jgi:hypothetical protein
MGALWKMDVCLGEALLPSKFQITSGISNSAASRCGPVASISESFSFKIISSLVQ